MANLKIEVWKSPDGTITACTDANGVGTRLCGIKLRGSGSRLIAEFEIDADAVDAIVEDFATAQGGA